MRQNHLHGELARHFAVRFSTHPVGQDVKLQPVIDGIAILVVFTHAPKIGARTGLNVQRGLTRLVLGSYAPPNVELSDRKIAAWPRSSPAGAAGPVEFRLANPFR